MLIHLIYNLILIHLSGDDVATVRSEDAGWVEALLLSGAFTLHYV